MKLTVGVAKIDDLKILPEEMATAVSLMNS